MTQEVKEKLFDAVCKLERREWPACLGEKPRLVDGMTDNEYRRHVTDPFYCALCDSFGNPREAARFEIDYYRQVTDGRMSEADFFRDWFLDHNVSCLVMP